MKVRVIKSFSSKTEDARSILGDKIVGQLYSVAGEDRKWVADYALDSGYLSTILQFLKKYGGGKKIEFKEVKRGALLKIDAGSAFDHYDDLEDTLVDGDYDFGMAEFSPNKKTLNVYPLESQWS